MHTQLEAIGEQAEDYKQMQDTFHISQYEFTQLRDTISQYKLKIEIWSKLDTWNKSMKEWKVRRPPSYRILPRATAHPATRQRSPRHHSPLDSPPTSSASTSRRWWATSPRTSRTSTRW